MARLDTYISEPCTLKWVMLMGLMVAAGGVALAHKMLKRSIWPEARKMSYEPKDQIIEIYDYEIVNENQNQGHKVIID